MLFCLLGGHAGSSSLSECSLSWHARDCGKFEHYSGQAENHTKYSETYKAYFWTVRTTNSHNNA